VFARARENARRSSCASNLKQIGLAVMQYTQDYDEKMPNRRLLNDNNSWRTVIQPYLKSTQALVCPSNPDNKIATTDPEFGVSYAANFNYGTRDSAAYAVTEGVAVTAVRGKGAFGNTESSGISLASLQNPSQLIAVVETYHQPNAQFSIDLDGYAVASGPFAGNSFYEGTLFSGHLGTSNYLFADGHVKSLRPLQTVQGTNLWYSDNAAITSNGLHVLQVAESQFK
jgi:prepilin-type processing-associated H-X9-DG protein